MRAGRARIQGGRIQSCGRDARVPRRDARVPGTQVAQSFCISLYVHVLSDAGRRTRAPVVHEGRSRSVLCPTM